MNPTIMYNYTTPIKIRKKGQFIILLNSKVGRAYITIALSIYSPQPQFSSKYSKIYYGDYSSITFFHIFFLKLNLSLNYNTN